MAKLGHFWPDSLIFSIKSKAHAVGLTFTDFLTLIDFMVI
ncbi:hypothetical protein SAMN04488500_11571 [Sporomusa malonica]|uniref:Uncharacterized protein n=1 Tax=Sporomusa malonica TaxID=112901 RepID=A0A1W2DEH8_9FIRM|nr:hypothetical protein SAMN04488500_11571 [Sporomusa malonica]